MSEQIKLSFKVTATDYSAPLGLKVIIDNNIVYEKSHISCEEQIQLSMSDDDGEHELIFELFGKKPEHTKINETGDIVEDAMLSISAVEIDDIGIDQIVQSHTVYHHDFNGTKPLTQDRFYGSMGCNGQVKLKFSTPFYLWLLENM